MQNGHEGVEHFRGYVLVHVVVLVGVHAFACEGRAQGLEAVQRDRAVLMRASVCEDALEELLDLFLVTDSIVVSKVPPFFVLVQPLLLSLSPDG
jgi:hypothetical protein